MNRVLSWICTPLHLVLFGVILAGFHIPLVFARFLLPFSVFEFILNLKNLAHLTNIRLTGARYRVSLGPELPTDRPLIFVANHQAMYDVPLIIWNMRQHRPKFIAKIELAKFIPSISFALRHGRHLIIKREEAKNAIQLIGEYGERADEHCTTVTIFPEGTRARDGVMKPFKPGGFLSLLRAMPNALIVPIAINGTWELLRDKLWPVPFGTEVSFTVLPAVEPRGRDPQELLSELEVLIRGTVDERQSARQK